MQGCDTPLKKLRIVPAKKKKQKQNKTTSEVIVLWCCLKQAESFIHKVGKGIM